MESNEVDVLPLAVLCHLQQVQNAQKSRGSCQFVRDVRQPDRLDRVDLDFAFFHAVASADGDVRARPDSHTTCDLAVSDAFTKTFRECHRAPDYGLPRLLFAEDVAHAADLGADAAELFFEVLVAAVEVVDAVEDGFAVGDQRGEDQRGGGAEVRAHDGGGLRAASCRGRWRCGR